MRSLEAMRLVPRKSVDSSNGCMREAPGIAATWVPAPVRAGDVLCARPGFELQVLFYETCLDPFLVHTYAYDTESNWTRYCPELSSLVWQEESYVCPRDGYVRVVVRRSSGEPITTAWVLDACVTVERVPAEGQETPAWLLREAERVATRVQELRRPDDVTLLLLADPHWAAGCMWDATVQALHATAELVKPDALVQLGDLTDGVAPGEVTRELASDMLDDLASVGVPVYSCVGNHDANYFKGNAEHFDADARSQLYLGCALPWYHVDFAAQHVRALFLDSFDPQRRERYGFSLRELRWVRGVLVTTPHDWSVVVFSHAPLLASMHVWSAKILHGLKLERMLRHFERRRERGALLAYIHGHNHADQVSMAPGFPVVSVGCAKFEDFPEHKPSGSLTPLRQQGQASQELWDVLLINADGDLRFVRFGAGEERKVSHA